MKNKFNESRKGLARLIRKNIFNLKSFNKALFGLMIVLGIVYLAGANDLAIKGYVLSDLRGRQAKAIDENKKLELKVMTLSSYGVVSEKINNLKMVAVGNIEYINSRVGVVAKK